MRWNEAVKGAVIVALTIIILAVLIALPVMLLWNLVMPDIFGLCKINFPQALTLALLSKCLFSGWGIKDKNKKEDE